VERLSGEPSVLVVENALAKARSVIQGPGEIILGSDTIVACDGELLGKPNNRDDARRMLELQLEHPQEVITGIAVIDNGHRREFSGYEVSRVVMKGSSDLLEEYLDSNLWIGKAGAYGIQDRGPLLPEVVMGNEDNVVGLPMTLLKRLLALVDFRYPERTPSGEMIRS
jgi:septum formation protein